MTEPVASYIDHTLLKPTCTSAEIGILCQEAIEYRFAAVCVPLFYSSRSYSFLKNSGERFVKTATVVGFPMGYTTLNAKLTEIQDAINGGVDELDVVINLSALKSGDWKYLETEMKEMTALIHHHNKIIKVIVESGVLTEDELARCCAVYGKLGIDYMKTSTGYAEKGASLEAVRLMRKELPPDVKIKASGGIRHYDFARQLIEAGADRIGCSASIQIVKEEKQALLTRL